MIRDSSCTLAAMLGAAVGAGLTYIILKEKDALKNPDEFEEACEKGLKVIDDVCDELEEGIEKLADAVEQAWNAKDTPNPSDGQTKPE
ncbi:hypothetical protein SAMN05660443_0622 [Marinospirillum celere]|uniref:Uncharacterized protein n=1 Tax=Marinospirillum celere TaxID=1122252 RepID=A0A1I1EI59_9GAMM|nr:hypothetical protein [Marinospirillum celere]SFB86727.1 hypothetical protein SAMN05660443_0622 [Marinospirillum celere]